MNKKSRFPSITFRLFSTIVVGMLLMNLFTIYITWRLADTAQTSVVHDLRQVQVLYANQIIQEMNLAQERINDIGGSYLTAMATSVEAAKDERQYEAMRCRSELNAAMRNWKFYYPMVHGYYIYGRNADMLSIEANSYEIYAWFADQIRGTAEEPLSFFRHISGWKLLDTPIGQLLACNATRRDICYGAWIQIDRLWHNLQLDEQKSSYSIVPEGTPAPDGVYIDLPLSDMGYVLRQVLPESAVQLPKSVYVLRILSYGMLLILPISWFILRRLVIRPLGALTEAIHEIEHGNIAYRIPEESTSYEFDQLNRQFNQSIETIAKTKTQMYETQLENERIRIRYLTQQMQPHFVLNTLNLIYSMEPSQYKLMQSTIQCLSRYYRYVAHINEALVPVEAELEHVKNYFRLQQIRYPDNFEYVIDCPEELLEFYIPPIVIQNFAENAIKHSLIIGERNLVEVRINRAGKDSVHISIHDSGTGYPPEVLEKIEEFQRTRVLQEGLGIGIQNTIERIDLIYAEGASLRFSNHPKGGAQVDIYLPECDAGRRGEKVIK